MTCMTDEERAMLREIHAALFDRPPGARNDERPLLEDLRTVVQAYKRASWVTRMVIWMLPTLAAIGASIQWVYAMIQNGLK